jgi:ligand-binding sensor domain-containing protein/serine phosphatase RsbU (regulator of sigma subunit)
MKFHLGRYFQLLIIPLLLIFSSCKEKLSVDEKSSSPQLLPPTENEYAFQLIPEDSIQKDTSKAVLSKKVRAGTPKIFEASTNIFEAIPDTSLFGFTPEIVPLDSNYITLLDTVKFEKINITSPELIPVPQGRYRYDTRYNVKYFDSEHGLRSDYVRAVFKDSRGDIWIGAETAGLTKYDGEYFHHYSADCGFPSDFVRNISEDKNGDLWFCTDDEGVVRYDGQDFYELSNRQGFEPRNVYDLCQTDQGVIWMSTRSNGIYCYEDSKLYHYSDSIGYENSTVRSIVSTSEGGLWLGLGRGACYILDGKIYQYIADEGFFASSIREVTLDKNERVWMASWSDGIAVLDNEKFTVYDEDGGLSGNRNYKIYHDNNENLWIGSWDGGLCKFDGTYFTHYLESDGMIGNRIMDVCMDEYGQLWLASWGGALGIFNTNSFENITDKNGLPHSLIEDPTRDTLLNETWFGSWGGGIIRLKNNQFVQYTSEQGLGRDMIWSVVPNFKEKTWLAVHEEGIASFDGEYFESYYDRRNFGEGNVHRMTLLNQEKVIFENDGEIVEFDGESFTYSKLFSDGTGASTINVDRKGNCWIGTYSHGIILYKDNSFFQLDTNSGLPGNYIYAIQEDERGQMWVAVRDHGLIMLGESVLTQFGTDQGLATNDNYSVITDENGIWLSSDLGLNFLEFENWNDLKKYSILKFQKDDGLQANNFRKNSAGKDHHGNIWWGSGRSAVRLNQSYNLIHKELPLVQMVNIEINGIPIQREFSDSLEELGVTFGTFENFTRFPEDLNSPFNMNNYQFRFTTTYSGYKKVNYHCTLSNGEDEWSRYTTQPIIHYSNLPYGNYTLEIKASLSGQEWGQAKIYKFEITPSFWNTYWAYLLFTILFIVLVYLLSRFRTMRLKKKQIELEKIIETRTVEVVEQKKLAEEQRDEVELQKAIVEDRNKEIIDSIAYAKRIQAAILPSLSAIKEHLPNSFVIYKPKDIVAGDFYWLHKVENGPVLIAAADCTGHGVPGAMVSVVCNHALRSAVMEEGLTSPSQILDQSRINVIKEFEKSDEEVKDGMDIALCSFEGMNLQFSGANNPLWIVRKNELLVFNGDKQPIGKYFKAEEFTNHKIKLQKEDMIYVFSDGYADQFGGEEGKKMKQVRFRELLISVADKKVEEQEKLITKYFYDWKGDHEQLDDVCVIGIRV